MVWIHSLVASTALVRPDEKVLLFLITPRELSLLPTLLHLDSLAITNTPIRSPVTLPRVPPLVTIIVHHAILIL
jgi:hypothetical protein